MSNAPPPATPPPKLSVHSHHININVGDSAIHLLVDDSAAKDNSTTITEWPIIYKAVLIDGGKTTGKEPILACIKRIENSYTFAPSKAVGKLQLDAVIITHWDVDHWGGIREVLQDSISEHLNNRADIKTFFDQATASAKQDEVKNLQSTVAGLQVPLFKYAAAEPATMFKTKPNTGTPPDPPAIPPATLLTTFYVPYIDTERPDNYRLGPKTSDSKPKVNNSGQTWISNHQKPYQVGKPNTLGLIGYYTYKIGTAKPVIKGFKFFDVCNLVANYQDYVGVDVFYNRPLPAGSPYGSIQNPGQLIKAQGLSSTMGPRMYIVAGDQVILGNTPLAKSASASAPTPPPTPPTPDTPTDPTTPTTPKGPNSVFPKLSSHPILRIVDERSSSLGQRYTGVRNTPASMNCPSIACLILSSTTTTPEAIAAADEGKSWKLWHYMAGDAFWDVEGGIATWLKKADNSNPTTTFMKISHHGGAGSTPAALLNTLKPNVVLIPAGDKQSFGHPRPEILMYLHALSLNIKPRCMRVYGFYWPVWLTRNTDHWSCNNFNKLPSGLKGNITDAQEVFIIQVMNLYKAASMTDSPLDQFWKVDVPEPVYLNPKKKTADEKEAERKWETERVSAIAGALRPFWDNLAGQSSANMPLKSILAIMDGTNTRLKEIRESSDTPHEWKIYESYPALSPPPVTDAKPAPSGPSMGVPDEKTKGKRTLSEIIQFDLPAQLAKDLKVDDGAKKQEDKDLLMNDVDTVPDFDEEGDYGPGLSSFGDDASESGNEPVSDENAGDSDEEMPEVKNKGIFYLRSDVAQSAIPSDNVVAVNAATPNLAGAVSEMEYPIRSVAIMPIANSEAPAEIGNPSDPTSDAPTDTTFYLCGADFQSFAPNDTQAPLPSGDFSNWVATLNNGYIALANAWVQPARSPNNTAPSTLQPVPANIHPNDEWFQRLYYNGLGIQQIVFVGYVDPTAAVAQVTALQVQLQLQVASSPGAGAQQTVNLVFSSDASKTVRMDATAVGTSPSLSDAMMPDYTVLALGLQSSSSTQLTVGQVISQFGMDYLPITAAGGLGFPGFDSINNATVTLDTSPRSRSSLSFKPNVMYSTWLRLRFLVQDPAVATTFKTNFSFLGSITLSNTAIVGLSTAQCQSGYVERQVTSQCTLETQITLGSNFGSLSISAWVRFDYAKTTFVIEFNDGYTWSQIEGWLVSILGITDSTSNPLNPTELLPNSSDVTFAVRQVILELVNPGAESAFKILSASIAFEITVYKTIFSLILGWPGPSIKARLWNSIVPNVSSYALLPYIEPYDQYTPLGTPTGAVGLKDICGSAVTPPPGTINLSPTLYELTLTASFDSNKNLQYRFTGTLQSLEPPASAPVPKLVLGDLDFAFAYTPTSGYDISLETSLYLVPRDYPATLATLLRVSVEYVDNGPSSVWLVIGSAKSISFATIYNLFDADASDAVMDILGTLTIPELDVVWDYSSGEANLFVNGLLQVGPFQLDLTYQYLHSPEQGQSAWTFSAHMGTVTSGEYNLARLIEKLGADQDVLDALDAVPFVANLTIPPATPTPGSRPPVSLSISKAPGKETIFWLQVAIATPAGTLSFTFVQLQAARSPAAAGSTPTAPTGFKRIIRVVLDQLPMLPGVPVVGPIPQPVDKIEYIWIGDSTVDNTTNTAGLTLTELNMINSTMSPDDYIPYKNSQSSLQSSSPGNAGSAPANPYVLVAGHHFIVQSKGSVILDHVFGRTTPSPQQPQALSRAAVPQTAIAASATPSKGKNVLRKKRTKSGQVVASIKGRAAFVAESPAPTAVNADSGSTKAPLGKSFGPLTIQNIGLQTKDGYLYILIDATVALGPIQLTVSGFGVGLPLDKFNLNELKNLAVSDFSIILSGMSMYFNSPPVLISGVFIIDSTPAYEAYKGGLAITMQPYSMLAVGEYQHTYSSDLKSVFIFGRFDGPLLTLEFAEISGVEVGFGYNYNLRTPTAADVLNFPLVKGVTAQNNPMETLTQFGKYISVEQDSVWLAFGFKVDAVQVLSMDAAAIVQFSASDVKVAIVGIASASMPPHVTNRKEMFLYVELGVVAALDITGGSLTCQAQLTPNSFVLYPDCHLVGGFALCYWFGNSPYAGDWVFTVGGYHPAYKPPSYYPVVPRVGINWNLSNCLTVHGEGFFAITPKVCMGGGRLLAVFSAGPIYATFQAWASFLINFKPFYFEAEIGVAVSCGFHCDLGLIHINIHADISATLELSGPPFGGVVHVDLRIHNFSIHFGDETSKPPALDWPGFLELVRQTRPTTAAGMAASSSALLVPTLVAGAATEEVKSSQQQTGGTWVVRAGDVSFRIECKFPIDDMSWGDGLVQQSWRQSTMDATATPPIYARPMQLKSPCTSLLTINIVPPVPASDAATDTNKAWAVTPFTKNLPDALWTQYNENEDPLASNSSHNSINALLNPPDSSGTSTPHLVGFTFIAPTPTLPSFSLPEFNAVTAMSEGVFQDGSNNPAKKRSPLLPPNPGNVDERPHLPQTPAQQVGDLPSAQQPADRWTAVQTAWANAPAQTARDLVDVWTRVLGWDAGVTAGTVAPDQASGFVPLVAEKPGMVLGDFENWYQSCPLVM